MTGLPQSEWLHGTKRVQFMLMVSPIKAQTMGDDLLKLVLISNYFSRYHNAETGRGS